MATNVTPISKKPGQSGFDNELLTTLNDVSTFSAEIDDAVTAINTVNENMPEITTVADDLNLGASSKIGTTATNIAEVVTVGDDLQLGASSKIGTVASSDADITTVATNLNGADTIGTVATNIANVNEVAGDIGGNDYIATASQDLNLGTAGLMYKASQIDAVYHGASATAPTVGIADGHLWFDTTVNLMKVYDEGNTTWVLAGSSINGTSRRQVFTASAGQTTFVMTGGYDAGYIDVFMNGRKLQPTVDFTATDGTNIVLTTGASVNDIVDVVAFGTFQSADHYNKAELDAGQLDNRYYTESELNAGQLDNRYYTESEINSSLATKASLNGSATEEFATASPTSDNDAINRGYFNANMVGMKNAIINGGFDAWQRGTTGMTGGGYVIDRWIAPDSNETVDRITNTNTNSHSPYMAKVTPTSGGYGILVQKIENVHTFAGKTVTFSAWVNPNISQDLRFEVEQNFGTGGSTTVVVTSSTSRWSVTADSWQKVEFSFALPSVSGKTIGANSYLNIIFGSNTGSASNIVHYSDVQLEQGSQATAFEHRPIGLELELCKRYYQEYNSASGGYGIGHGFCESSTQYRTFLPVKGNMRTTPSLTFTGSTSLNIGATSYASTGTAGSGVMWQPNEGYKSAIAIVTFTSSGMTAGQAGDIRTNTACKLILDAEL